MINRLDSPEGTEILRVALGILPYRARSLQHSLIRTNSSVSTRQTFCTGSWLEFCVPLFVTTVGPSITAWERRSSQQTTKSHRSSWQKNYLLTSTILYTYTNLKKCVVQKISSLEHCPTRRYLKYLWHSQRFAPFADTRRVRYGPTAVIGDGLHFTREPRVWAHSLQKPARNMFFKN